MAAALYARDISHTVVAESAVSSKAGATPTLPSKLHIRSTEVVQSTSYNIIGSIS